MMFYIFYPKNNGPGFLVICAVHPETMTIKTKTIENVIVVFWAERKKGFFKCNFTISINYLTI
jgi:hypothetical protein